MTALQQIIKEAKRLSKVHPKLTWKECVKKASDLYNRTYNKPVAKKKVGDYHVNSSNFYETTIPSSPRKRPIVKKKKEFAVVRKDSGEFSKIKRVAGIVNHRSKIFNSSSSQSENKQAATKYVLHLGFVDTKSNGEYIKGRKVAYISRASQSGWRVDFDTLPYSAISGINLDLQKKLKAATEHLKKCEEAKKEVISTKKVIAKLKKALK